MYADDDRDIGSSGDWVDKVMVNKLDGARGTVGSWEAENSRLSDSFYQKYLPEQSYNMFQSGNGFDVATTDDLDELDAATSDSSEPDLLWQYNHSKLPTFSNGNMPKLNNLNAKPIRSPDLRYFLVYLVHPWLTVKYKVVKYISNLSYTILTV